MTELVHYRKRNRHYKYETLQRLEYETGWSLPHDIHGRRHFITLERNGRLHISMYYAWDGPSGPTFDTPSTMRASLVHDALYQLLREGDLGQEWRPEADELLGRIMLEDYRGKWPRWHRARVRTWVWIVKKAGAYAARPEGS